MASSNGQVNDSGDHGSSSTVPVISAISEPGERKLTAIDIESGEKQSSVTLPEETNELSGVVSGH